MLVDFEQAGELADVKAKTIHRYTYPYFVDKRYAQFPKTKVTGQYMVDTVDLKETFPKHREEIESFEQTADEVLYKRLEQKAVQALEAKDFDRAIALITGLKAY